MQAQEELKLQEREVDSQQALGHQEESNQLLRQELRQLQKRLEDKEKKLTEANEVCRNSLNVCLLITGVDCFLVCFFILQYVVHKQSIFEHKFHASCNKGDWQLSSCLIFVCSFWLCNDKMRLC